MKRNIFLIVILLLISSTLASYAQSHFSFNNLGLKAGPNIAHIKESSGDVSVKYSSIIRINGGITYDIDLPANFTIQPAVLYNGLGTNTENGNVLFDYISVPVLTKYKIAQSDFSVYAGPQASYLLRALVEVPKDFGGGFMYAKVNDYFKKFDFGGVAGINYLAPHTNLSFSLQYLLGFANVANNEAVNNDFPEGVYSSNVKNNAFTINVAYIFKKQTKRQPK